MNISTLTKTAKLIWVAALGAALGLFSAGPAAAQQAPSYATAPPSYATAQTDETIRGTIRSINGQYNISVRDERGFIDNVSLHQGTIINPTGLTLAPGQRVTILGHADGRTFAANEIDTPYLAAVPVPVYPYGFYGYPYGYGPAVRVGFRFGR
jgi:hypothetical protein